MQGESHPSPSSDFVPIRQVALETLDSIQSAAKNAGAVTGVSTGFYDLDARTAGLQKSDLILIAARPSMGKTAFVLNIAENVAIKNNCYIQPGNVARTAGKTFDFHEFPCRFAEDPYGTAGRPGMAGSDGKYRNPGRIGFGDR